mgnify:CR=1 FL=1
MPTPPAKPNKIPVLTFWRQARLTSAPMTHSGMVVQKKMDMRTASTNPAPLSPRMPLAQRYRTPKKATMLSAE